MITEVGGAPVYVWRAETPWLAVSSAVLGGGFGERSWVVNATVSDTYERLDPDRHLAEIAASLHLTGDGIGLLTAVDVREVEQREDSGVRVAVTTGIGAHPTWAAGPSLVPERVGTINAICWLPVRLTEAALVNAVATVAEAKAQALFESGVPGTGTPTDSVVVLCPPSGPAAPFGGPRSVVGGALARAVHSAIRARL
ncbi:adenosylcobinamide amidohydrolase [Actinophytocola glycyrrhizae]|uniref:Adenosylcobinamide amidohydrolase n=1 Tax=Actinophytocola glycyrrhizae TaxID=2044873 RepID=A0ABV9RW05_9PSEU